MEIYTPLIAFVALIVSTAVLAVQLINQKERRHGELAQLQSDLLTRIALQQQRATAQEMRVEHIRRDLRKLPDNDDKYDSIERTPSLLKETERLSAKLKGLKEATESMDIQKKNNSNMLIRLRTASNEFKAIEKCFDELEEPTQKLIIHIQSELDHADAAIKAKKT